MAGAPPNNRNAIRHGLMAGSLPKGAAYVKRMTVKFRAAVEDAVAETNGGDVSLHDAAVIQTAIRWERHALLAQRWLRQEAETMTPDQRLAFSRDVARASAERDKCLKLLGLDRRRNGDPWSALDVPPGQPPVGIQDQGIEDQHPDDQADDSTRGGDQQPDDQASLPSNGCGLPASTSPGDGASESVADTGDLDQVGGTTTSGDPTVKQDGHHDQAIGGETDAS